MDALEKAARELLTHWPVRVDDYDALRAALSTLRVPTREAVANAIYNGTHDDFGWQESCVAADSVLALLRGAGEGVASAGCGTPQAEAKASTAPSSAPRDERAVLRDGDRVEFVTSEPSMFPNHPDVPHVERGTLRLVRPREASPAAPVGCIHGRPAGHPCPHCLGEPAAPARCPAHGAPCDMVVNGQNCYSCGCRDAAPVEKPASFVAKRGPKGGRSLEHGTPLPIDDDVEPASETAPKCPSCGSEDPSDRHTINERGERVDPFLGNPGITHLCCAAFHTAPAGREGGA